MRTTLTKSEIRQVLNEDPAVLWYRQVIQDQFDTRKNIQGAANAERLWQIKGHAEVLHYLEDIDIVLNLLDVEDDE